MVLEKAIMYHERLLDSYSVEECRQKAGRNNFDNEEYLSLLLLKSKGIMERGSLEENKVYSGIIDPIEEDTYM